MQKFATFEQTLAEQFGGRISSGSHVNSDGGQACLLECAHAAVEANWSDTPDLWPDLRAINDAGWSSDAARTAALVPVLRVYWNWSEWSDERQAQIIERVSLLTIQRLVAELPELPDPIRAACRAAQTPAEASWAASAAIAASSDARAASEASVADMAARAASWAASAARAARAASWKVSASASDRVLINACAIWIEAGQ